MKDLSISNNVLRYEDISYQISQINSIKLITRNKPVAYQKKESNLRIYVLLISIILATISILLMKYVELSNNLNKFFGFVVAGCFLLIIVSISKIKKNNDNFYGLISIILATISILLMKYAELSNDLNKFFGFVVAGCFLLIIISISTIKKNNNDFYGLSLRMSGGGSRVFWLSDYNKTKLIEAEILRAMTTDNASLYIRDIQISVSDSENTDISMFPSRIFK